MSVRIEGMERVLKDLDRQVNLIEKRTRAGLLAAGIKLLGASMKQVPRRRGDLARSGYARYTPEDPNSVEVGYSIHYALWVHEMRAVNAGVPRPEPFAGVIWGPDGKPKFLEDPFNAMREEIIKTIQRYVEGS